MKGMPQRLLSIVLCLVLFSPTIIAEAREEPDNVGQTERMSPAAVKLREDMRRLWTDQTLWTRSYIVSAAAGLEDQAQVLDKLLKHQEDIGNAFQSFYGEAPGNQLTALLKQHVFIADKIVDAAKNEQQIELKTLYTDWYQNADEIAGLLSGLNMNWTLNELRDLFHAHLQQVTDIVEARLKKDANADILAFEQGEDHILIVADTLTEGIVRQFPDQFL